MSCDTLVIILWSCAIHPKRLSPLTQIADKDALEADLEARASVGGGALAAVLQANEKERNLFDIQSESQRLQLSASVAWDFRKVREMKC